mmetsp:Transcript_1135/g.2119  ORF Transcript_1135/g.2119 Transcript_1135/m.2119 type:complete len:112 (-) Transcript_1135:264-599(-)
MMVKIKTLESSKLQDVITFPRNGEIPHRDGHAVVTVAICTVQNTLVASRLCSIRGTKRAAATRNEGRSIHNGEESLGNISRYLYQTQLYRDPVFCFTALFEGEEELGYAAG